MVLPHSALQTGQYKKWRDGHWGDVQVDLGHHFPWDLERIEPNTFFPIPASVVFAQRTEQAKPLPQRAQCWRGPEGGPYKTEMVKLIDNAGAYASPYGERARKGADIYPRVLFYVNLEEPETIVQVQDLRTVSPRRSSQEKQPWKALEAQALKSQPIEAEHVFDVHLGETVAPYLLLDPLKAVLPLSHQTGQLERQDGGWYGLNPLSLGDRMRQRWRAINELWDKHKNPNNKLSLRGQIDYMKKLSAQGVARPSRVVYTTAGRPTAAVVDDPTQ